MKSIDVNSVAQMSGDEYDTSASAYWNETYVDAKDFANRNIGTVQNAYIGETGEHLDAGTAYAIAESIFSKLASHPSNATTQDVPIAVLRFQRGKAGHENDMPQVVSCMSLPDGEYQVYAATVPQVVQAPQEEQKLRGMLTGGKPGPLAWVRLQYPDQPTTNKTVSEAWKESGWNVIALDVAPQPVAQAPSDSMLLDFLESNASVNFSFDTASIEFELKDDSTCFNSIRALLAIASNGKD